MSDFPPQDRFAHNKSNYERPTKGYVCGRAAFWGKPCASGPDANGGCGGVADCQPFKEGDRWECRRTASQGGKCAAGPNPDGSCCNQRPPCAPVPSVRRQRGRLALVGAVLAICVLGMTLFFDSRSESGTVKTNTLFSNPGELSDVHHAFSAGEGCQTCHLIEEDSVVPSGFVAVIPRQDIQAGCVNCHEFGGPAASPHNDADLAGNTNCTNCHTEHQGRFANLTQTTNQQCAFCHEQKFDNFADHVAFDDRFPSLRAGQIVFDHNKHVKFHFQDKKYADAAPAGCTDCHQSEAAGRRVDVKNFEQMCASCHLPNIVESAKGEMAFLDLPKLKLKRAAELAAFNACGAEPGETFKSNGKSRSNPFINWLLGAEPKKKVKFAEAYCGLLQDLRKDGIGAIFSRMSERGVAATPAMFSGISRELVSQVTEQWITNERYRPPKQKLPKGVSELGWYVDRKGDLKYKPVSHADPVAMAWIDFAKRLDSAGAGKLASKLTLSILSDDKGLGACGKCHNQSTMPAAPDSETSVALASSAWHSMADAPHHRFVFNHDAHLSLVGARNTNFADSSTGCAVCHKINDESNYAKVVRKKDQAAYQSNFQALTTDTCAQCHNEESIQADCRMCHQYHEEPRFSNRVLDTMGARK
ncbi:MAG: hypothetical protein HKN50_07230 [Gammaproteobacteria bacterium]|nr:hypothetical protein [Gammaproteobacteria bacterium]